MGRAAARVSMSSHRDVVDVLAAEKSWRELAARADYHPAVAARLLRLSLRQLERHCQRQLGCSPRDLFQRERMARAAQLLAAGQPAKAVALELGYSQLANFSRDFKHHHGRCPTVFAPKSDPFTAFLATGKPAR
jgi:AraC-like DNA-binding protein